MKFTYSWLLKHLGSDNSSQRVLGNFLLLLLLSGCYGHHYFYDYTPPTDAETLALKDLDRDGVVTGIEFELMTHASISSGKNLLACTDTNKNNIVELTEMPAYHVCWRELVNKPEAKIKKIQEQQRLNDAFIASDLKGDATLDEKEFESINNERSDVNKEAFYCLDSNQDEHISLGELNIYTECLEKSKDVIAKEEYENKSEEDYKEMIKRIMGEPDSRFKNFDSLKETNLKPHYPEDRP